LAKDINILGDGIDVVGIENIKILDSFMSANDYFIAMKICNEIENIIFSKSIILYCVYEGYQIGSWISININDNAFIHDIYNEYLLIENSQEKFVDFKIFDSINLTKGVTLTLAFPFPLKLFTKS